MLLREAAERGVVLTGGSAGAICWFQGTVVTTATTTYATTSSTYSTTDTDNNTHCDAPTASAGGHSDSMDPDTYKLLLLLLLLPTLLLLIPTLLLLPPQAGTQTQWTQIPTNKLCSQLRKHKVRVKEGAR